MAEKTEFMKSDIVKDFTKDIHQYNLGPLWEAIPELMHKTPEPHAQAYLWKGSLLHKKLMEAAEIFTPEPRRRKKSDLFTKSGIRLSSTLGLGINNANILCSCPITSTRGRSSITSSYTKCSSFYYRR